MRALAILGVLVSLTACTGGGSAAPGALPPASPRADLVAAADLDPCPRSADRVVNDLPALTLSCLGAGPDVHLGGLGGRPMLLNVWGSWCGPCQEETPFLAAVYDDLHRQVRFLGVDVVDDPNSALDFAAHVEPRMRYPSVRDDDKQLIAQGELPSAVPMTLFVDEDGQLVHTRLDPYDDEAELRSDIARYLGVRG